MLSSHYKNRMPPSCPAPWLAGHSRCFSRVGRSSALPTSRPVFSLKRGEFSTVPTASRCTGRFRVQISPGREHSRASSFEMAPEFIMLMWLDGWMAGVPYVRRRVAALRRRPRSARTPHRTSRSGPPLDRIFDSSPERAFTSSSDDDPPTILIANSTRRR